MFTFRTPDKWAGIFCFDAKDAEYWRAAGAQFITIGSEGMIFASALRQLKKDIGKS